jgi:glutathione S-transferase
MKLYTSKSSGNGLGLAVPEGRLEDNPWLVLGRPTIADLDEVLRSAAGVFQGPLTGTPPDRGRRRR